MDPDASPKHQTHEPPTVPNAVAVEAARAAAPRKSGGWLRPALDGMSWYGFELAFACFGLLVTGGVISYGIFTLLNYMKGIDDPMAAQYIGEFSLFVVAAMVVWLPLTLLFYMRVRAEITRFATTRQRTLHKAIVAIYLFHLVVMAAGFAFTAVYSLMRMAVGIEDNAGDVLVRLVIPSLLSAVVAVALMYVFGSGRRLSRKNIAMALAGAGAAVIVALMAVSVSDVRATAHDEKAHQDLSALQEQVRAYYDKKQSLPDRLEQVDGLKAETKGRLSRYTYKRISSTDYQLCATFQTDTMKRYGYSTEPAKAYDAEYSMYADFTRHEKGEKCFKLTASYSNLYNKYDPDVPFVTPQVLY